MDTRLLIRASRTIGRVVCGGVEGTSTKGSMRVSVVGSYPKAAGLKMTGLGGLDETGDGGEDEALGGGSRNRVTIGGGGIGDVWVKGASRVRDAVAPL